MAMMMGTISQTCCTENTINAGTLLHIIILSSSPRLHLKTANWSPSWQLGFLTTSCYDLTIFLSVCLHSGPEKLLGRSDQK